MSTATAEILDELRPGRLERLERAGPPAARLTHTTKTSRRVPESKRKNGFAVNTPLGAGPRRRTAAAVTTTTPLKILDAYRERPKGDDA